MHQIAIVLTFFLFFGSTVAIILIDGRRQRAAARVRGEVDFMDRSLAPYLALALVSGALPLLFYFGSTRKGVRGWLLGAAAVVADVVAVSVVGGLLIHTADALQLSMQHRAYVAYFGKASAACGAPFDAAHPEADPCRKVLDGSKERCFAYDQADSDTYVSLYVKACDSGRVWACDWAVHPVGCNVQTEAFSRAWEKEVAICKATPNIDPVCATAPKR